MVSMTDADSTWHALRSSGGHRGWTATDAEQHGNLWRVTLVMLLGIAEDEGGPYWSYGEPVYAWGETEEASRAEAVRLVEGRKDTTMADLHLFLAERDASTGDLIIAYTLPQAKEFWAAVTGEDPDADLRWRQLPDTEVVTVASMDEPGQPQESKTAAEWCAEYGVGYWYGWA